MIFRLPWTAAGGRHGYKVHAALHAPGRSYDMLRCGKVSLSGFVPCTRLLSLLHPASAIERLRSLPIRCCELRLINLKMAGDELAHTNPLAGHEQARRTHKPETLSSNLNVPQ